MLAGKQRSVPKTNRKTVARVKGRRMLVAVFMVDLLAELFMSMPSIAFRFRRVVKEMQRNSQLFANKG
jgi:hypothetical protein